MCQSGNAWYTSKIVVTWPYFSRFSTSHAWPGISVLPMKKSYFRLLLQMMFRVSAAVCSSMMPVLIRFCVNRRISTSTIVAMAATTK